MSEDSPEDEASKAYEARASTERVANTPKLPEVDLSERAGHHTGAPRSLNRRMFMQLWVFECGRDLNPTTARNMLAEVLVRSDVHAVTYDDVSHPRRIALLSWSEDPGHFVGRVRDAVNIPQLNGLSLVPEFTMLGRSYAIGYEPDLEFALLERPVKMATTHEWPYAVWYPLRRNGAFEQLSGKAQAGVLREHAAIGRAYGEQGFAHDIRLVSHGLDARDNEFVIGLVSSALHPLSHLVQRMRKTKQTSEYISQMGPFFVGRKSWCHPAVRCSADVNG